MLIANFKHIVGTNNFMEMLFINVDVETWIQLDEVAIHIREKKWHKTQPPICVHCAVYTRHKIPKCAHIATINLARRPENKTLRDVDN